MTTNDKNTNSKYTPDRYQSEKSYNDVEITDSQVLVPFVIRDKAMLVNKDVNRDNLKTFNIYGKRMLVGFVPVERAEFANALRVFNMDTNEYLSSHSKGKHDDLSLEELEDLSKLYKGEVSKLSQEVQILEEENKRLRKLLEK